MFSASASVPDVSHFSDPVPDHPGSSALCWSVLVHLRNISRKCAKCSSFLEKGPRSSMMGLCLSWKRCAARRDACAWVFCDDRYSVATHIELVAQSFRASSDFQP